MSTETEHLEGVANLLATVGMQELAAISDALFAVWRQGGTVYLAGNGGSAATASHLACDLAKATIADGQPRLRAVALTDSVPLITAWANDANWEVAFAEQVKSHVRPGDALLLLSASGSSPNILRAAAQAGLNQRATIIALTGFGGGVLHRLADVGINLACDDYAAIEDVHSAIGHALALGLRDRIAATELDCRLAGTCERCACA